MPTEPRWTTETYDPADPANYPDHPGDDEHDEPPDAPDESHGESTGSARAPEDLATEGDDDDGIDVTDTQTGQGVD